jgi:hypothetical protein
VKKKTKFTLVHINFPVPARQKPNAASRSRANGNDGDRNKKYELYTVEADRKRTVPVPPRSEHDGGSEVA